MDGFVNRIFRPRKGEVMGGILRAVCLTVIVATCGCGRAMKSCIVVYVETTMPQNDICGAPKARVEYRLEEVIPPADQTMIARSVTPPLCPSPRKTQVPAVQ
ncbi:MAG: hypothetical protein Greene041619_610 [Candidatus Peregrinibacteria bacterium Greene0416_19]|nr:MAG: hypothetical protein Greene041619_610 [Candidatus Peregrinibacteria bacterium Greene0416_19]